MHSINFEYYNSWADIFTFYTNIMLILFIICSAYLLWGLYFMYFAIFMPVPLLLKLVWRMLLKLLGTCFPLKSTWKFLADSWVTRPPKSSWYTWLFSFHIGALLCITNSRRLDVISICKGYLYCNLFYIGEPEYTQFITKVLKHVATTLKRSGGRAIWNRSLGNP